MMTTYRSDIKHQGHHAAGELPETWLIFGSTAALFVAGQVLCFVFKDSLKPHPAGDGRSGGGGGGGGEGGALPSSKEGSQARNIYEDDNDDDEQYYPAVESQQQHGQHQNVGRLLSSNSLEAASGKPSPARPVPRRQRSGMLPNDPFKSSYNLEGLSGSFKSIPSSVAGGKSNPSTTPRTAGSAYFTPGTTPRSSLGRALSSIGGAINRASSWSESTYRDNDDKVPWEDRSEVGSVGL